MCLRAKKHLFASAFGMLALVFLSATNTDKLINVINGNGKGGKLGDIIKMKNQLLDLKPNDYYLDNVTGDLYYYSYETNEWVPKFNVGIHNLKAAQAFDSVGKFVIKTPAYKSKSNLPSMQQYVSKNTEDFCYIKKIYLQHWSIQGIDFEFVVPLNNTWDIHQFNFINPERAFVVLAESARSPQIIYFESYCVATLFQITKKYRHTVKILDNFISQKLSEINSQSKFQVNAGILSLTEADYVKNKTINFKPKAPQNRYDMAPRRITANKSPKGNDILGKSHEDQRTKRNKHSRSGLAYSHQHGPNLYVDNNTVMADRNIKMDSSSNQGKSPFYFDTGELPTSKESFRPWSQQNNDIISLHNTLHKQIEQNEARRHHRTEPDEMESPSQNQIYSIPELQQKKGKLGSGILKSVKELHSVFGYPQTRTDIALTLYPDLQREGFEIDEGWIPGQMTKTRTEKSISTKPIIRIETPNGKFYNTYSKFKSMVKSKDNVSVQRASRYETEEERYRRHERENSHKLLGPPKFNFGKTNTQYINNYINQSKSISALNHSFRDTQKGKWIAHDMKHTK